MTNEEILDRFVERFGPQTEEAQESVMVCLAILDAMQKVCGPVALEFVLAMRQGRETIDN